MSDIQVPKWIDRLRRAGGTKGPAQVPLDDSLYGMVQVDDLNLTPYKWLSRGFVWIAPFDITAAAAQFATATVNFSNVPRTQYLTWIREVCICSNAANSVKLCRNGTGIGAQTGQNLFSRDSRADFPSLNTFLGGLVTVSVSSAAATVGAAEVCGLILFNTATQPVWFEPDIVLADGQAFNMQATQVATQIRGYIKGETFLAEPSEFA